MNDQDQIYRQYERVLAENNKEHQYNEGMKEQQRPFGWSHNEENFTIDQLTAKIEEIKEKIAEFEHKEDDEFTRAILKVNRRGLQHLMKLRADKMASKAKDRR